MKNEKAKTDSYISIYHRAFEDLDEIQKVAEACLEIAEELWPVAVKSYRERKK